MKQQELNLQNHKTSTPEPELTIEPAFSENFDFPGKPGKRRRSGRFQYRRGMKLIPIDRALHQRIRVEFNTTSFAPQINTVVQG